MKKKTKKVLVIKTNISELSQKTLTNLSKKLGVFLARQKLKELDLTG